ncbi:MAG: helix-turn-helix domain-containing protein, partial [Atribacteria sp.]|nr:helix-turn-helix domain-containing protein [Candidatus Atribacteria bacterium]
MEKGKPNNQNKLCRGEKEGYLIIPNYFLREWVKVLGIGPALLYLELLTYCHKEKYIAWPTINSLCQQMGIAKTTLLRYQNTLIKFGLIKNITRGKSTTGHYRNNIYQITSLEELSKHRDPDKIIDFVGSKMKPDRYQNDTCVGSNLKLSMVSNRYPNNNNLNNNNITTTKRKKDAVVAVVNFKKLKEKGEEKMQAVREQLRDLDFEGKFIEQLLKDYPPRKIEEKLDLLMERRNIQNPAGWLRTALKNDYQDPEQERYDEEPAGGSSNLNSQIPSPLEGEGLPCVVEEITAQGKGEGEGRGLIHQTRLE